jgi:hypothetical protein
MSTLDRWLGWGLIALGAALALNSLLGPFATEQIRYHFSETLINQTIGLDAVSLIVVAPLSLASGIVVLRGKPLGALLAFGPALYALYMFLQYISSPEYTAYPGNNERFFLLHLALFVLPGALFVLAWVRVDVDALPRLSARETKFWAGVLLLLATAFVLAVHLPTLVDATQGDLEARSEYLASPNNFWDVKLLDLGVAVPLEIAVGIGLLAGAPWAMKGLYAAIGWFALVGVAVAAMGVTMYINDDPEASGASIVMFGVMAAVFSVLAVRLYWPLFVKPGQPSREQGHRAAAT